MALVNVIQLSDGVTTIDLSDKNPISIRGAYTPEASIDGENITESFEIYISSTSAFFALEYIQSINKLLLEAAQWEKNHTGRRVFVYLDPADIGQDRRARIIQGVCRATPNTLGHPKFETGKIIAVIEWTRTIYEAKTPYSVTLGGFGGWSMNPTLTNTMDNASPATYGNYVEIYGTALAGDFYAPAKVKIQNADGGAAITSAWLGSVNDVVMAFTLGTKDHGHHFEAEAAADYGEVSGTIVADAAASGGSYTALSWTSAAEVAISNWALTGGEANYFGGGKYAIMARLAGTVAYTDLYLRFTFGSNATIGSVTYFTPEWSGSLFKVPLRHEIFQIDTPYLPPYIPVGGSGTISAKTICLYGLKGDGSAVIMNLDYFNMLPVSPESELNYLTCNTVAGVAQNEYLIGDWINQSVYKTGTVDSDYSAEFIQQQGKGIYLTPGQNSRVYVYVEGFAGTCDPFRTHVVSMWYSPRYRTV